MLRAFAFELTLPDEFVCASCKTILTSDAFKYTACACDRLVCKRCSEQGTLCRDSPRGTTKTYFYCCALCGSMDGEYRVEHVHTPAADAAKKQAALGTFLNTLRAAGAYGHYLDMVARGDSGTDITTALDEVLGDEYVFSLLQLEEMLKVCGWNATKDGTFQRRSDSRLFTGAGTADASADALIVYTDGFYYRGAIKNGAPHGQGSRYHSCGCLAYRGGWQDGLFDGDGVEYHANRPEFSDLHRPSENHVSCMCGECGSYTETVTNQWTRNEPWYEGEFKNGRYNGQGRLNRSSANARANCDQFVGHFKDGVLDGVGKHYDFSSRKLYKGEFKAGLLDGNGEVVLDYGDRYKGEFRAGKRHGINASYQSDGFCELKGEYVNDTQEGNVTYYHRDGSWFEGVCRRGRMVAGGTGFHFPDGSVYTEGGWSTEQPTHGTHTYLNGDRYEGSFDCGLRSGHGTCFYKNGDIYHGEWKDDRPHGDGAWRFRISQSLFQGHWYNGQYDGRGVYSWTDGCQYEASWRNGLPTAGGTLAPKQYCLEHIKACKDKAFEQPPYEQD